MDSASWFNAELNHQNGTRTSVPVSKVICVGRNYVAHAQELNNPVPEEPVLFIKPNSSLTCIREDIGVSQLPHSCHYEAELALLIGKNLHDPDDIDNCVVGVGLALDLTFRDVQSSLKQQGYPWERAKAFRGSCPVTSFVPMTNNINLNQLSYYLKINNEIVQQANTGDMIFNVERLISETVKCFGLVVGDIILTGTPSGVGKLVPGDSLELGFDELAGDSHLWLGQVR